MPISSHSLAKRTEWNDYIDMYKEGLGRRNECYALKVGSWNFECITVFKFLNFLRALFTRK